MFLILDAIVWAIGWLFRKGIRIVMFVAVTLPVFVFCYASEWSNEKVLLLWNRIWNKDPKVDQPNERKLD